MDASFLFVFKTWSKVHTVEKLTVTNARDTVYTQFYKCSITDIEHTLLVNIENFIAYTR